MTEQIQEFYPTQVWAKAKLEIQRELSSDTFDSWFKGLECSGGTEECINLTAESDFTAMWVEDNYSDIIAKNLSLVCGRNVKAKISAIETPAQTIQTPKPHERVETKRISADTNNINTVISPRNTFENFVVFFFI